MQGNVVAQKPFFGRDDDGLGFVLTPGEQHELLRVINPEAGTGDTPRTFIRIAYDPVDTLVKGHIEQSLIYLILGILFDFDIFEGDFVQSLGGNVEN